MEGLCEATHNLTTYYLPFDTNRTSMVKNNRNTAQRMGSNSKSKRWFAEASGWGLSLSLGSGTDKPKGKRSLNTSPNSQFYVQSQSNTPANFLHNTLYTANVMSPIIQGTGSNQRIGNNVYVRAVHGTFSFDTAGSTNPASELKVRIMLLASTVQSTASTFNSGLGSTQIFFNTSSGNLTTSRPDPRVCKIICDEIITVTPSVTTAALSGCLGGLQVTNVGCVLDQEFQYREGTVFGTAANLYWVVLPFTSGGVTGTTTCATMASDIIVDFQVE